MTTAQTSALSALKAAQTKVNAAEARLVGAERERDAALLAAKEARVPERPLYQALGVSRQTMLRWARRVAA
jgi:hypothetical protein